MSWVMFILFLGVLATGFSLGIVLMALFKSRGPY